MPQSKRRLSSEDRQKLEHNPHTPLATFILSDFLRRKCGGLPVRLNPVPAKIIPFPAQAKRVEDVLPFIPDEDHYVLLERAAIYEVEGKLTSEEADARAIADYLDAGKGNRNEPNAGY